MDDHGGLPIWLPTRQFEEVYDSQAQHVYLYKSSLVVTLTCHISQAQFSPCAKCDEVTESRSRINIALPAFSSELSELVMVLMRAVLDVLTFRIHAYLFRKHCVYEPQSP